MFVYAVLGINFWSLLERGSWSRQTLSVAQFGLRT